MDSSKKILLEIITSLKDIWDWAPILEENIKGGYLSNAQIEEIDAFLREKAKNYKHGKDAQKIQNLARQIDKYRNIEAEGKRNDSKEAAIVLGYIA